MPNAKTSGVTPDTRQMEATLRTLLGGLVSPHPATPDFTIRKDCPICRRFITKSQVAQVGAVDILPQDEGWWQLFHTRCLRQWVVASYGAETVIDISGPAGEGRG